MKYEGRRETAFVKVRRNQVDMMRLPTLRFLISPLPPVRFASRFLAAVMRPPLLLLDI